MYIIPICDAHSTDNAISKVSAFSVKVLGIWTYICLGYRRIPFVLEKVEAEAVWSFHLHSLFVCSHSGIFGGFFRKIRFNTKTF